MMGILTGMMGRPNEIVTPMGECASVLKELSAVF
jgi:hypothetical protein